MLRDSKISAVLVSTDLDRAQRDIRTDTQPRVDLLFGLAGSSAQGQMDRCL